MISHVLQVVDALAEIESLGCVGKLEVTYWSRGSAFI